MGTTTAGATERLALEPGVGVLRGRPGRESASEDADSSQLTAPAALSETGQRELGRAGRGAAAALLYETVIRFRGLILLPILTKCLPSAVYGLYVQVMVIIGVGTAVCGLQLQHGLIRFLPGARDARERSSTCFTFGALTALCGLVLVPALCVAAAAVNPRLGDCVLPLGALVAVRNFTDLFAGYLRARERMFVYASVASAATLCEMAVIGVSAATGASLAAILWRAAAVNCVVAAATGWGIVRGLLAAARPDRPPRRRGRVARVAGDAGQPAAPVAGNRRRTACSWRAVFGFSAPLVVGGLAWWVVEQSDRLIIGAVLGDQWAGYYNPAYILGALILVAPRLAGTVIPPMAARLHDGGREGEVRVLLASYWKVLLIVGVPFVAACLVLQEPVLSAVATREVAEHSRGVTPLVAVSTLFLAGAALFGEVMKLKMRTGYLARVWVGAAAVSLGLNLLLVRPLGIIGGAVSALVSFGLAFALVYRAASRYLRVALEPLTAVRCAAACVPLGVLFWAVRPTGMAVPLLLAGLGLSAYVALLFVTGVLRPRDLGRTWSILAAGGWRPLAGTGRPAAGGLGAEG